MKNNMNVKTMTRDELHAENVRITRAIMALEARIERAPPATRLAMSERLDDLCRFVSVVADEEESRRA